MDWKDVGTKIATHAPELGTLLGSVIPGVGTVAGGAVGMGIKALATAFGLKDDAAPEEIVQAIQSDPEAALKLRQADMDFQIRKGQQRLDEVQKYLNDIQNARQREVEVTKATGRKEINLYILAYSFVGGFFTSIITMIVLILSGKLPESMPEYVVFLLGSLFGTLTAGVTSILQYFFGSSKGSNEKTQLLANGVKK